MNNYETLAAENSANSSTDKKVNKRRSAVFKRQSIVSEKEFERSHSSTEEINHESKKIKLENEKESVLFDLRKYIESLKDEDKKWRDVYTKRKFCIQDLVKRGRNQEPTRTTDITCLSDFERAFLAEKPNYEEFNKNLIQLGTMASKVSFLHLCAANFQSKSLAKLQSNIDNVTRKIINFSD